MDGWMDIGGGEPGTGDGVRGDVFSPIVLITSPTLTASVLRPSSAQVNTMHPPGWDLSRKSSSV